ncbi:MAG: 8-amino-7-oxononanoate synthase [Lysobacterales bacterium CG17_big_fil_post_rev_8_21_14_2_50_64_11]|nr:MAG: 8-amino-7-oxononanoate synthase [Xanthomonadales bacterium CG17_big_fil_post_rev_8_21_14_2_50_64_11]PIX59225.1 MAG: 8-amino-7-oxononanoate synthase [Xanthomonadales bacterium CG_4_10_14_3_um_filter_64_11]
MSTPGLLDKFAPVAALRDALAATGRNPTGLVTERLLSPTLGIIEGRETILAGTNNYLGLTFDPACIAAGKKALDEFGTGTTGSRMANGSFALHQALEAEMAAFYGQRHGMVFSTGYAANLGMLSALLGAGDAVLLDADAHASLYDGCRMSGAQIFRFRHNDTAALESRLRRLGEQSRRALIVVEGLYSVFGDVAPLAEMIKLKHAYGAYLLVDEAHSLGVYGATGRGVAQAQGVEDDVDFTVGTFSKSLGATGGYCVSNNPVLPLIRYTSRPFIFTASASPSVVATTREALRQVRERPELRTRIWANANRLYAAFQEMALQLGCSVPSPVLAVRFSQRDEAFACWQGLIEAGVYTNLMVPPASPDGSSLLRVSVSAAHTPEQVEQIIAAFAKVVLPVQQARAEAVSAA